MSSSLITNSERWDLPWDKSLDCDLAERITQFLNELVKLDHRAVAALIAQRVPCNAALAEHPSVQIGKRRRTRVHYDVGMLGIVNGLCGTFADKSGPIAAVFEDAKLLRFEVRKDPTEAK